MHFKTLIPSIAIILIGTGCTADGSSVILPATSTPDFVTATLPPTSIPQPTQTPLPPTPIPTIAPIAGTTSTQVNVRAETSTASESLGVLPSFSTVQVTGKDASGIWLRILYPDASTGVGWVRAEFVQVDASAEIPVVSAGSSGGVERSGVVLGGINVRDGPGTEFESLGVLVQNDVVVVFGKDSSGAWIQIEFDDSPDSRGWVAAEFLEVEEVESLPVIGADETAGNGEPQAQTPAPAFVQTAVMDGDSEQSPLAEFTLAPQAMRAFQVTGDVSAPNGDAEDWVGFSAEGLAVTIELTCSDQSLRAELWNNGIRSDKSPACGKIFILSASTDSRHQIRLFAEGASGQEYASYILKVFVIR